MADVRAYAPRGPTPTGRPLGKPQARPDFRGDIEGLRGVAVIAVVLYHAGFLAGGFIGVDLFFVVSGFLITGLLWRELQRTGRVSFTSFYARRVRRLLPASVLVLVTTVLVASQWLSPLSARAVAKDATAAALYVANYRFAALRTDYLTDSALSPLQHYWTLSVEEQFYLLWPLLLVMAAGAWRRSGRVSVGSATTMLVIVGATSLALSVWLTSVSQPWAFFSLPTRAWEFVAGGLVALGAPRLRHMSKAAAAVLGWLGVGAIAWAVIRISPSTAFPGTAVLAPVGGTVALLSAGCAAPARGVSFLLAGRALQAVGRVSYSWYLWHWPVLTLPAAAAGRALGPWQRVAFAGLSGALAVATTKLVENPLRFSPRLDARSSLAVGLALTAAAATAGVVTATSLPVPRGRGAAAATAPNTTTPASGPAASTAPRSSGVTSATEAVAAAVTVRQVPANLQPSLARAHADKARPFVDGCNNPYRDARVHACEYGSSTSATTVVLFGDSHAAQWFPALDAIAAARAWRLVVLTKATCPPVELSIRSPVLGRRFAECDQWREAVLQRISAERPALVVLGAARHYDSSYRFDVYGPEWISGLANVVRRVHAAGARVAVLSATPRPKANVPDCLSKRLTDATACTQSVASAVDARGLSAEREAVVAAGGRYVDVTPWVCSPSTCAVIVGNLLVYRDDNHLTTPYVTWLAPVLASELHVDEIDRRATTDRN